MNSPAEQTVIESLIILLEAAAKCHPDDVARANHPFMGQDISDGKKGAGILRAKPNVKWSKDRGKGPLRGQAQFPWFWNGGEFTRERVNDVHLTNAQKKTARERVEGKQS